MTMPMPASPTVLRAEHGEATPHSSVARSGIAAHGPLLLATGLGVATAFFRLGTKGLWGDEVWNVFFIQPSLTQTFLHFPAPPNLPLNFLLVQTQGAPFDLAGVLPDRSRRGLPCDRSRRPGVNQTKPPETTLVGRPPAGGPRPGAFSCGLAVPGHGRACGPIRMEGV
jgi:hypothetical protein